MRLSLIFIAIALVIAVDSPPVVCGQTFLVDGRVLTTEVQNIGDELWVSPESLLALTGFSIKPEGACRQEMCVPMNVETRQQLIKESEGSKLIKLKLFLDFVKLPVAIDQDAQVWSLGRPAGSLANYGSSLAEDFELTSRTGEQIRLSDFRGKKVILFTWASW